MISLVVLSSQIINDPIHNISYCRFSVDLYTKRAIEREDICKEISIFVFAHSTMSRLHLFSVVLLFVAFLPQKYEGCEHCYTTKEVSLNYVVILTNGLSKVDS